MDNSLENGTAEMFVFDLSLDVEGKFNHLLSQKAISVLKREGSHGIGALVKDDDGMLPVGTLVFLPDMLEDEDGRKSVAELNWLYVDEEYRNMGVGRLLMETFAKVVNNTGIHGVICDVPLDSEYDELVTYLADWGFIFSPMDKNEFVLDWDDIQYHPILGKRAKTPHVTSLGSLPKGMLETSLRMLQIKEWSELSVDEFDPKMSGIYFDGNTAEGIFLIRKDPDNMYELLLLKVRDDLEKKAEIIKELLFHAKNMIPDDEKEDLSIYVIIRSLKGAELWDALFPEEEPALVRRGVNILEEESDDQT